MNSNMFNYKLLYVCNSLTCKITYRHSKYQYMAPPAVTFDRPQKWKIIANYFVIILVLIINVHHEKPALSHTRSVGNRFKPFFKYLKLNQNY